MCYKLSTEPLTFTEAQLSCTSPPNSKYVTKLAYPSSYQHQQNLLILARNTIGVDEIFMGINSHTGNC